MPRTSSPEASCLSDPVEEAKRKQKSESQEETEGRKRLKGVHTLSEIEFEALNGFYPLLRDTSHTLPVKRGKYVLDRQDEGPSFKSKSLAKMSKEKQPTTRFSKNRPSAIQRPLNFEMPGESLSEGLFISAQEELMQMIDDRASDTAIANQLKIVKMLRARHSSQDLLQKKTTQHQQRLKELKEQPQKRSHKKNADKTVKPDPPPINPLSISSPFPEAYSLTSSVISPDPKVRPPSTTKARCQTSQQTKQLLKTARPAATPTSLPATQRTNKSLTTQEVALLSKTHSTFDEEETSKLDRHTRKINGTAARASDRVVMKERGMEDRIRAPSESAEEENDNDEGERATVPHDGPRMSHRGSLRNSFRGRNRSGRSRSTAKTTNATTGRLRLNAESLKAIASTAAAESLQHSKASKVGAVVDTTTQLGKEKDVTPPSTVPMPERRVSFASGGGGELQWPAQIREVERRRHQYFEQVDSDDD